MSKILFSVEKHRVSCCRGQPLLQVQRLPRFFLALLRRKIIITKFVLEVDVFAFEHLQSDVHVVDLLQAADGRQAELRRQTPVLDEQLHHTSERKPDIKETDFKKMINKNLCLRLFLSYCHCDTINSTKKETLQNSELQNSVLWLNLTSANWKHPNRDPANHIKFTKSHSH